MRRQVDFCVESGVHGVAVLGLGTGGQQARSARTPPAPRLGGRRSPRASASRGDRLRTEHCGSDRVRPRRCRSRRRLGRPAAATGAQHARGRVRPLLRRGCRGVRASARHSERAPIHRHRIVEPGAGGPASQPPERGCGEGGMRGSGSRAARRRDAGGVSDPEWPRRTGAHRQYPRRMRRNDSGLRERRCPGEDFRSHVQRTARGQRERRRRLSGTAALAGVSDAVPSIRFSATASGLPPAGWDSSPFTIAARRCAPRLSGSRTSSATQCVLGSFEAKVDERGSRRAHGQGRGVRRFPPMRIDRDSGRRGKRHAASASDSRVGTQGST